MCELPPTPPAQLWDVEQSVLAPRLVATRLGRRFTALAFSQVSSTQAVHRGRGTVAEWLLRWTGPGTEQNSCIRGWLVDWISHSEPDVAVPPRRLRQS